ncbi:hypothetical protein AB0873_30595 [Micromonospora sp. NPDC047707]|uniref:hypothetical protein n=1 Tax=Micromonospora sp. NPDC047707 TaxID=3154498 RepID=UPI003453A4A1
MTELSPSDRPTRDDLAPTYQQRGELSDSAPSDSADPPRARSGRWFWVVAAALVLLVVVVGSAPYLMVPWRKDEAVKRCQVAIKEKLRPSPAKFGPATVVWNGSDPGVDYERSIYDISGPVDVQDAFGATVRRKYLCVVFREHSDGTWLISESTVINR